MDILNFDSSTNDSRYDDENHEPIPETTSIKFKNISSDPDPEFVEKDPSKNKWKMKAEIKDTNTFQTDIRNHHLHQNSPIIQITAELISPYHPVDKNVEYKLVQFTIMEIEMNYGDNIVKRIMIPLNKLIIDKPAEKGITVKCSSVIKAGESPIAPFELTSEDSPVLRVPFNEEAFPGSKLIRVIRDQHFYTYLIKEMKNEEVDKKYREIGCLHWAMHYDCEIEYLSSGESEVKSGGVPEYRSFNDSCPPFPIGSLTTIRANCNNCYIYINNVNELIYFEFVPEYETYKTYKEDPDFKIYKEPTVKGEEVVGFMISINYELETNLQKLYNNQTWKEIIKNFIKVPFLELIRQIKGKLNSPLINDLILSQRDKMKNGFKKSN